jgi:Caspase domain
MTSKSKIVAVLVECDPGNTLGGSCVRDVHNMAEFLFEHSITNDIHVLLTDLSKSKLSCAKYSSSKNIFKILDEITLKSGDKLIVLVSGHGYSVRDKTGDEIDGRDEYINVGFQVKDDDLYERIIMKNNIKGVDIILMSDTCHSGTMFDLPYSYDVYHKKTNKITKRNDRLQVNAIAVSACADSQLSMCDIGSNAGFGGSLTVGLLEYPSVMIDLIEMRYDHISKLFDRLKKLNQQGVLSLSHD